MERLQADDAVAERPAKAVEDRHAPRQRLQTTRLGGLSAHLYAVREFRRHLRPLHEFFGTNAPHVKQFKVKQFKEGLLSGDPPARTARPNRGSVARLQTPRRPRRMMARCCQSIAGAEKVVTLETRERLIEGASRSGTTSDCGASHVTRLTRLPLVFRALSEPSALVHLRFCSSPDDMFFQIMFYAVSI